MRRFPFFPTSTSPSNVDKKFTNYRKSNAKKSDHNREQDPFPWFAGLLSSRPIELRVFIQTNTGSIRHYIFNKRKSMNDCATSRRAASRNTILIYGWLQLMYCANITHCERGQWPCPKFNEKHFGWLCSYIRTCTRSLFWTSLTTGIP